MVRLEFQENAKMLMVPTNNIFDQKYCRIITRTSLCNSNEQFQDNVFFQSENKYQGYSTLFIINPLLIL